MLKVAALGAFVGPIVLFVSDLLLGSVAAVSFEWTIGMWVAMMLMIPAVIGLTYLLASSGSRLAIVGGCFAFFGLVAGASMQVLFRVYSVLLEQGSAATVEQLRSTFKLVASTQMIGLTWPIGLLLLSISCLTTRVVHIAVPIFLTIAAIAFPIGRILFSTAGVLISGACFVIAFSIVGMRLWSLSKEMD
jgi:hypothetical protein